MRRSAKITLTLVPLLASAHLARAQAIPDDPAAAMAAAPPAPMWAGPPGMTEPVEPGLMPPSMVPVMAPGTPVELMPCSPGDDRPQCRTIWVVNFVPHFGGVFHGGFGHYFGGGGGG